MSANSAESSVEFGYRRGPTGRGRRFRALTIVDVFARKSLAIEARPSLNGEGVPQVLNCNSPATRHPKALFCDHGSELTSQAMDLLVFHAGVQIDFSRPGKPTENAYVESFNGTLRSECRDAHWFTTLTEAKPVIETWRREYNYSRPPRALGERTPNEIRAILIARLRFGIASAGLRIFHQMESGWTKRSGPPSQPRGLVSIVHILLKIQLLIPFNETSSHPSWQVSCLL